MNNSDPPRKTIARNPSHFGSYRNAPTGSSSASFASIGSIGGSTANVNGGNSQRSATDRPFGEVLRGIRRGHAEMLPQPGGAAFDGGRQRFQTRRVTSRRRAGIALQLRRQRVELIQGGGGASLFPRADPVGAVERSFHGTRAFRPDAVAAHELI